MNVLMLTPMVPSADAPSAGAIVMHREVTAVAAHHDVTLATLATMGDEPAVQTLRDQGLRVHAVYRQRDRGLAAMLRRATLRWRHKHLPLRTLVFHERAMQATIDRLGGAPFDVVHVLDNAMAHYRRPRGSATVLSEYEVRVDADQAEQSRWRQYQSEVWAASDRVQVFTARDADTVCRLAPRVAQHVSINPFGVDIPDLGEYVQSTDGSLVFVGGFSHPPNVDAAVWLATVIFPLVQTRFPTATLTIVGADPPAAVRALAGAGTTVTGRVDTVDPYLQAAAVVVAPVRFGGGMRLKVLQAMAHGRPVVTTTRGAEGVWNPADAPTLAVADDAPGIAKHIVELLSSRERREVIGSRARRAVQDHHTWQQFADRIDLLYASLPAAGVAA